MFSTSRINETESAILNDDSLLFTSLWPTLAPYTAWGKKYRKKKKCRSWLLLWFTTNTGHEDGLHMDFNSRSCITSQPLHICECSKLYHSAWMCPPYRIVRNNPVYRFWPALLLQHILKRKQLIDRRYCKMIIYLTHYPINPSSKIMVTWPTTLWHSRSRPGVITIKCDCAGPLSLATQFTCWME